MRRLGLAGKRLVAALLLGSLLGLASCGKKSADAPPVVYNGPLMETTNVLTLFSDSARLKLRLTAPVEQQFENGDVLYPKGMVVTFFAADGKSVVNTLRARYGKVDKVKNLYIMRGDVRVANVPQQQKMFTEELFFDKGQAKIYTRRDMFVRVETPFEALTGKGLTANQDFSRYRIFEPIGSFAAPAKTGM
jgi:LPS export ABC transporter protein LptC